MKNETASLVEWGFLAAAACNSTLGNLLLKKSRLHKSDIFFEQLLNPWFIAGLFFYAVNVVLFAKALDAIPVSVAYPILASAGFVMLVISAGVLFSEKLALIQLAGIVFVLLGIILVAKGEV